MCMRLAFASTDGRTVNEHFGSAARFHVYTLGADGPQRSAIIDCETGDGHDTGRLQTRIAALKDCRAVFCIAIGQGALRETRAAGLEALRVSEGVSIASLLADWAAGRLLLAPRPEEGRARFDKFLDEGWEA
jgi:nitrogen fixation protein NifX